MGYRAGRTSATHSRRARRALAVGIAFALLTSACTFGSDEPDQTTASTESSTSGATAGPSIVTPVNFTGVKLSAGQALAAPPEQPLVTGTPLDESGVQNVVDQLPPWEPGIEQAEPFSWPPQTIVAPQVGTEIDQPFPAPTNTPVDPVDPGPLQVLRVQPEGQVTIAPFVSITFNQPMVPITTVSQLAAIQSPATITPELPGTWQWIGTSTLRFDADSDAFDRLPMATDYTVTVPAGTLSAAGTTLEADATFTFSTPPAAIRDLQPTGDSLPLTPVFLAVFDQQIDAEAVLATISLTAGGQDQPVRLATADEIAADTDVSSAISTLQDGRWLAFRADQAFATDTEIDIEFASGTPSAEGPLTAPDNKSFEAHTYQALALTESECGWGDCVPGTNLVLTFNNELDASAFDPAAITVTPELPGIAISASGNAIQINGASQGSTTYQVTLPAGLTDTFGQQLGADQTIDIAIGAAEPRLRPFSNIVTTLDPMAPTPSLTITTVNRTEFRARVFAVTTADWQTYQQFVEGLRSSSSPDAQEVSVPSWPLLSDEVISVAGSPDQSTSTVLDLSTELPNSSGQAVVLLEPTGADELTDDNYWQNAPTVTWAQATTIGLDAVTDPDELRVWATELSTGSPLADVSISTFGSGSTAVTDADGLADLSLTTSPQGAIVATSGDQTAILPDRYWGGWTTQPIADTVNWLVNDDRQTYRPGETVSIKGWARLLTTSTDAQLTTDGLGSTVTYQVLDGNGLEIGTGETTVGALGGFDFTFDLPVGANLGEAVLALQLPALSSLDNGSNNYGHTFQIADFRRPDFEIDTHPESTGPYVLNTPLTVAADATYYAGGPLGAAPVDWQVSTTQATYAPPGWDQFTFGIWTPWWISAAATDYSTSYSSDYCCGYPEQAEYEEFTGTTDPDGSDYLQVQVGDLGEDFTGLPVTVTAQATVTDVNRQAIAGTANLLVHPADYYVGLNGNSTFVRQGETLEVGAIVTDIDGAAVAGREITVQASRITYSWVNGESVETLSDTQTCIVSSGADKVNCSFVPAVGGSYRITGVVVDDQARPSRTELTRWVGGADKSSSRSVAQEALTLVPDLAEYAPGSTAQILVQSPIATGTGLLTIGRNGIVSTSTFVVADGSAVVTVPIAETDVPNLDVMIEVVGSTPRTLADGAPDPSGALRPAYATGSLTIPISTVSRELTITAVPQDDTLTPGATTAVDVTVVDHLGQPVVGSEFEVVVVDEAVLALSDYQLPDPLAIFYGTLWNPIDTLHGRSSIELADLPVLPDGDSGEPMDSAAAGMTMESAAEAAGGAAFDESAPAPALASVPARAVTVRQNFDALAVFKPSVITDDAGKATVEIPLPDSLTRYRVMVVAVAGDGLFGTAEANITAQLPLTVRPTAPRFLNFGDTFELPVLVQNLSDSEVTADVVVQTGNLTLTAGAGQQVVVPANSRVEVRFPMAAAQVGTASFRVAVVSGDAADAATVELPVYTPATSESVATYGVLDGGGSLNQPITAPTEVIEQFGGLTVSTSATALQELTDAVLDLTDYDFESSDASASQILAIATLGDVLAAFNAPDLPSPEALSAMVEDKINELAALQNGDGGFPYWRLGDESQPFNSIQATHALTVAAAQGYVVPPQVAGNALSFLVDIDAHIDPRVSQSTRDSLNAYALYVRALAGDPDADAAESLFALRGSELSLDSLAWLWPVVGQSATGDEISRLISNAAVDTAGAVTFTGATSDDAWLTLQSDRRTDGLVLDALITMEPSSDLIPKVVSGLLGARIGGHWNNVQENSFILLALRSYFDTFENVDPNFIARVWLGQTFAGEHPFIGYTTDRSVVEVPTTELVAAGDTGVVLSNDGEGRLYYRIGLKTAPSDLTLDPLDRGYVVSRTYEAVDDPSAVSQDENGTWHFKAGATVRIRLSLVAPSETTHVALIDPLPAGLEILNPDLATTPKDLGPSTDDAGAVPVDSYWTPTWFDHQNLRDDRAEAFATVLPGGVYEYSYLAVATTIGSYVAPPTRAEQIYAPETFGRAGSDSVVIEG